ncbi:MAG TPA: sigma-70 family RNA polymerase sigma factor [Puia sp.]|nr:sigma-70 family RNA polymerase sigma factor [Puia sp.]
MNFLKKISASTATDPELLALYKQTADSAVLAELYQRYMDLLYAVCLKYLNDPETAKDAVMAIFEELIPKLKKHEVTNFKGWVYAVTRNHCLMQLRSANPMVKEIDEERMQLTEELHLNGVKEKEWHLNMMGQCLEGLSADQKKTVELFYLQEKSYKAIAELSGFDHNKVRSLIQNGRRNLKICMEARKMENNE